MEFDELHVGLGELTSKLDVVELRTNGKDMPEGLLGVFLAPCIKYIGDGT